MVDVKEKVVRIAMPDGESTCVSIDRIKPAVLPSMQPKTVARKTSQDGVSTNANQLPPNEAQDIRRSRFGRHIRWKDLPEFHYY